MSADVVVNHVGLCVHDLARSRRFYEEVLGFEPDGEVAPPDDPTARLLRLDPPVGLRAVYLRKGSFRLELLAYESRRREARERPMDEPGLTHLSIGTRDFRAVLDRVEAYGGTVLADTDVGRAVFLRDPDGQLIELLDLRVAQV
jgi:catechol 2,3-dioxygenase-like lactoylglutathione lyase family enzyme